MNRTSQREEERAVWRPGGTGLLLVVLLLGMAAVPLAAQKRVSGSQALSLRWKQLATLPAGQVTGEARCQDCHKAEVIEFHKTVHALLRTKTGKPVLSCENCHGPGKAHSDAEEAAHGEDAKTAAANKLIFAFNGTPEQNAARCLTCHATGKVQGGFAHSTHLANGVSCSSCHATHLTDDVEPFHATPQLALTKFFAVPKKSEEMAWLRDGMLKQPQPTLCFTCHGNVRAKFALPTHHRVEEGLLKCTDCHNPHARIPVGVNAKVSDQLCLKCHPSKRGPFVYEHPASLVAGCVTCHTPHGSVNRMLLVNRDTRTLCLQCHIQPFANNVPHGRLGFQALGDCVRCHVAVHGSNSDSNLLK